MAHVITIRVKYKCIMMVLIPTGPPGRDGQMGPMGPPRKDGRDAVNLLSVDR